MRNTYQKLITTCLLISSFLLLGGLIACAPPTFSINGSVSGEVQGGVNIELSSTGSDNTTITAAEGSYIFEGLGEGEYTITPSLLGYTFTPESRLLSVTLDDLTGAGFTATRISNTYMASGTVSGDTGGGVAITLSGDISSTLTTTPDGSFTFAGLINGSYTFTPNKNGYTFSPASESVTIADDNATGISFTATQIPAYTDVDITMVSIPGGTFERGCSDTDSDCFDDEFPQSTITISSFKISAFEITQGQWKEVMKSNPSSFTACGDNCPVETVSWSNVRDFIDTLNSRTGKQYRLPTEAEWEYAARANTETTWHCGDNETCLDDIAWYSDNSGNTTHKIGQKDPNDFNLYDMSGNVWEWVSDNYLENYYSVSPDKDPQSTARSLYKVIRGGGWADLSGSCRSSNRSRNTPIYTSAYLGFRLVLD